MKSPFAPIACHVVGDANVGMTTLDFLMSLDGQSVGLRRRIDHGECSYVTAWIGSILDLRDAIKGALFIKNAVRISLPDCDTQFKRGNGASERIVGEAIIDFPGDFYNKVYDHVCFSPQTAA